MLKWFHVLIAYSLVTNLDTSQYCKWILPLVVHHSSRDELDGSRNNRPDKFLFLLEFHFHKTLNIHPTRSKHSKKLSVRWLKEIKSWTENLHVSHLSYKLASFLWVDSENVVILCIWLFPRRISVVDVDVDSAGLVQALSRGALRSSSGGSQEYDL